jgi:hypothetical protein
MRTRVKNNISNMPRTVITEVHDMRPRIQHRPQPVPVQSITTIQPVQNAKTENKKKNKKTLFCIALGTVLFLLLLLLIILLVVLLKEPNQSKSIKKDYLNKL